MSKNEKIPSCERNDVDEDNGSSPPSDGLGGAGRDEENPPPPSADARAADRITGLSQADADAKAKAKAKGDRSSTFSTISHDLLNEQRPPVPPRLTLLAMGSSIGDIGASANSNHNARRPAGLEEIHDDAPPANAPGAVQVAAAASSQEKTKAKGKGAPRKGSRAKPNGLEQIHDDDAAPRPDAVGATEVFSNDDAFTKKMIKKMAGEDESKEEEEARFVELVHDDEGPSSPFVTAGGYDDDDHLNQKKPAARRRKPAVANAHRASVAPVVDNGQIHNLNSSVINALQDTEYTNDHVNQTNAIQGQYYTEALDDDRTLDASVVPPIEGFLVVSESHREQNIPLVEGVIAPDEEPPPEPSFWEKHQSAIVATSFLVAAGIIAAIVGAVIATSGKGEENTSPSRAELPTPTMSPTLSPPPLNCTVEDFAQVYEEDRKFANQVIAKDGDTMAIYSSLPGEKEVQYLAVVDGSLNVTASYPRDHYIGEMAFSENSFFASDLADDTYGAMVISLKDSSGAISSEITQRLGPNQEEMKVRSRYGDSFAVDEDVLVVGANRDGSGSVFIYRQTENLTWFEEDKLVPDDSSVRNFGSAVLVKDNVVIVAASDEGSKGKVFFYKFDLVSSSWQQMVNTTLVNEDCDGEFGSSLALTGDDGLLVGCPLENESAGVVYYYQKSEEDGLYNHTQTIAPEAGGSSLEKFGGNNHHLAVNSKGDLVGIGTYSKASGLNEKVYIFAKLDNVWREVAKIDSPKNKFYFGDDVVISGDTVLVTAWENTYSYRLACVEVAAEV